MIKNKVKLNLIPENIKKGITKADKTFGDYLKVNKNAPVYNFGAGYYFTEPD